MAANVQPDSQLGEKEKQTFTPPGSQPGEKAKQTFTPPISQPGEKEKQTFTPSGIPRSDKTNERPATRSLLDSKLADHKDQKLEKQKAVSQAKEKQRQAEVLEAAQQRARAAKELEEERAEKLAKLELAAQSRIGVAKLLIDDQKLDKAKAKLEEVIKLFPETNAAKVAKKMLDALEDN